MTSSPTTDPSTALLIDRAQNRLAKNCRSLWIADENVNHQHLAQIQQTLTPCPSIITNRYDLYQQAYEYGLDAHFNDFDFSRVEDHSIDCIFFRISKEKAVTHHIINSACEKLTTNGTVILTGEKSDGIKRYSDNAKKILGLQGKVNKHGKTYYAELTKKDTSPPNTAWLDDNHYPDLRPTLSLGDYALVCKPGCYGWNKIDTGSELLINTLTQDVTNKKKKIERVLDLGCGYGYLSLCLAQHSIGQYFLATDNNAAAIASCQHNFSRQNITGQVVADNCAASITQQFDLIVCNPPFHKGFTASQSLTDTFLDAARKRLTKNGSAYFVTNRFIAIEKKAKSLFSNCDTIAETNQFKVMRFSH